MVGCYEEGKVDLETECPSLVFSDNQFGVCEGAIKQCNQGLIVEPNYSLIEGYQEGAETSCDGLDNDCDGRVDENLVAPQADLQQGVCSGAVKICNGSWVEPDYTMVEGFERDEGSCDLIDNDCDGAVDESRALIGPLAEKQQGVCRDVPKTCTEGTWVEPVYAETVENYEIEELECDLQDNDCDGQIDEINQLDVIPLADRQAGLCQGLKKRCARGRWVEPDYGAKESFESTESSCDGLDNDCDGTADEARDLMTTPRPVMGQLGICAEANLVCQSGMWTDPIFSELPNYQRDEKQCDGLDNDCDGVIDEPDTERCDGIDNDCDGEVDEARDLRDEAPFANEQRGICLGLKKSCVDGRWTEPALASVEGYEPSELTCDGLDNDCDGQNDEPTVLDFAPLATLQDGVCSGLLKVCDGAHGWIEPDYASEVDYTLEESSCNGLDEDCDGVVDELPAQPCNAPCQPNCPELNFVRLNGGPVTIGAVFNPSVGNDNEQPVRTARVPSFELMTAELTVGEYRLCVDADYCELPQEAQIRADATWRQGNDALPMNYLSWTDLSTYAQWVGARLPSEVEWEWAAKSGISTYSAPWGTKPSGCFSERAHVGGEDCNILGLGDTCSKPTGDSLQGLCDLIGNLAEWTLDEYQDGHTNPPSSAQPRCLDQICIENGSTRVVRGGDWETSSARASSAYRREQISTIRRANTGGRLARDMQ